MVAITLAMATGVHAQGPSDVAARVGGVDVRVHEVDAWLSQHDPAAFERIRRQQYEQRRVALDGLIADRLLQREAEANGLEVEALLEREVQRRTKTVGPQDVAAFLIDNPLPPDVDRVSATPTVMALLQRRARDAARQRYLDELRHGAVPVQLVLEPPRVTNLTAAHSPSRGRPDAPVTVVVCRRVVPALERLTDRFPNDVQLVWRHYPLAIHRQAARAAQASQCAHGQGRFWEYHDALFQQPDRLDAGGLEDAARRSGLDVEAFRGCVALGARAGEVALDQDAGRKAGVSGTPTVFVNGIPYVGALSFEAYEQAVLEELSRRDGAGGGTGAGGPATGAFGGG
jgi:protein-disulfide isomerase